MARFEIWKTPELILGASFMMDMGRDSEFDVEAEHDQGKGEKQVKI